MLTATQELWGYRALVLNLTNREIKSQFKMTFLGNLWALINPMLTLAVYSLVFGYILSFHKNTPEAWASGLQSFPLYLFCALMMWWLFNRVAIGATAAFTSMGSLLRKVYFPPSAPIVAHGLAQVRQTMLEGLVCMLVMVLVGNTPWTFILWPLLIPFMLAFGLGTVPLLWLAQTQFHWVRRRLSPLWLGRVRIGLALSTALVIGWRLRATLGFPGPDPLNFVCF